MGRTHLPCGMGALGAGASIRRLGSLFSVLGPRSTQSVHLVRLPGGPSSFKQDPPASWSDWTGNRGGWRGCTGGGARICPTPRSRALTCVPTCHPQTVISTLHSVRSQLLPHTEDGARCGAPGTGSSCSGKEEAHQLPASPALYPVGMRHLFSGAQRCPWHCLEREGDVWLCLPVGLTGGSTLCSLTRDKGALWGDICFAPCLVVLVIGPPLRTGPAPLTISPHPTPGSQRGERTSPLSPEHHSQA